MRVHWRRKLFTEHARGVKPPEPAVVAEELGETMVRQGDLRVLDREGRVRGGDPQEDDGDLTRALR